MIEKQEDKDDLIFDCPYCGHFFPTLKDAEDHLFKVHKEGERLE